MWEGTDEVTSASVILTGFRGVGVGGVGEFAELRQLKLLSDWVQQSV